MYARIEKFNKLKELYPNSFTPCYKDKGHNRHKINVTGDRDVYIYEDWEDITLTEYGFETFLEYGATGNEGRIDYFRNIYTYVGDGKFDYFKKEWSNNRMKEIEEW